MNYHIVQKTIANVFFISYFIVNVNMLKSVYSINDNNCEFVTLLRTNADQKEYELQSIEKQYFHKHKDKLMKHKV